MNRREIKFKVWCKENEEFIQFNKMGFSEDGSLWYAQGVDENEEETDPPYFENQNDWELMQYTGLKDNNGVEIYEGDILKTFSNINKYTDSFAEDIEPKFEHTTIVRDGACFKTTYKKRPSYVLNENGGSMVEHMEVIGNIYENPELLEREN